MVRALCSLIVMSFSCSHTIHHTNNTNNTKCRTEGDGARFFGGDFYPFHDASHFRTGTEGFDSDETNREGLSE